jgi:hypothetical protein
MFYWYFPARQSPETAPISIWVGGGPGESALAGAMAENGPCFVNSDSNSTTKNKWSRNERVNMLYIDQPVGAGYSYSKLVNVTFDQTTSTGIPTDFSQGIPFTPNITVFPGTLDDPNLLYSANNSNLAAKVMWHFGQAWFGSFPFLPQNKQISLWTNSVRNVQTKIRALLTHTVWWILWPCNFALLGFSEQAHRIRKATRHYASSRHTRH